MKISSAVLVAINAFTQAQSDAGDNRDNVYSMLKRLLKINGFRDDAELPLNLLQQGCWLQLLNPPGWEATNRAEPVNEMDYLGRSWYKCHQCTTIDDSICLGMSQNYGSPLYDRSSKSYTCPGVPGTCEHNACSCDVKLAEGILAIMTRDGYHSEADTVAGGFDPIARCVKSSTGNGSGSTDSCCGTYPNRFPFHSENGARACCYGKTYDANALSCCADGSIDMVCDLTEDACDPNPCMYGGTCSVGPYGTAVCSCTDKYTGQFCETKKSKRDRLAFEEGSGEQEIVNLSENEGELNERHSGADLCEFINCEHGGTCNMGSCDCPAGYSGEFCQRDPCAISPCRHGQCVVIGGTAICECAKGYYGDFCEISACDDFNCENNGKCVLNEYHYPVCQCPEGFEGLACEEEIVPEDPCLADPCFNGAACQTEESGFTCNCTTGFIGRLCEESVPTQVWCYEKPLDILFVVDRSTSMRGENQFFDASKAWIENFIGEFDLDLVKIGVITYANSATLDIPMKNHFLEKITKRMDGIELDENVGSDLSDAANLVRKVVGRRDEDSDAESIVIILSDFWDSGFEVPEFLSDAPFSALATLRTSVISVGLGEEPNEIIGQIAALNQPENFIKAQTPDDLMNPDFINAITRKVCYSDGREMDGIWAELESQRFDEEFDVETFEDLRRESLKQDRKRIRRSISDTSA